MRGLQKLLETLQLILGLGTVQSSLICDIDCFVYIKLIIFILKLYISQSLHYIDYTNTMNDEASVFKKR